MRHEAAIVGGAGYVGGELLRLLLTHPGVEVRQVTSRRHAGLYVHTVHPNLRGLTDLRFIPPESLKPTEVLFLALPHGEAARAIERYASLAEHLIDTSPDFRLRDAAAYERWYGEAHPAPAWLPRFVYGLPERYRSALRQTRLASGVGCNAAAMILALGPLADAGCLARAVLDLKVGSSEGGATPTPGSHHPERSGAVRVYSTFSHRHLAEVEQALGPLSLQVTATAIEMVRGVHLTAHCDLTPGAPLRRLADLWDLYRERYAAEPFIRLVAGRRGLYRYPEPKILAGTNFCDIGFAFDERSGRVLVFAALDNLMKGAAGSAVQSMNLMLGFDEREGLTFPGLHPI